MSKSKWAYQVPKGYINQMRLARSKAAAITLLEQEHGDCDSTTCSVAHALANGCYYLAIDTFVGSGAASDALTQLHKRLPGYFSKEVKAEIESLKGAIASCPNCHAYTWDLDSTMDANGNVYCDSCAKIFYIEAAQNFKEGVNS